ncbi:hypothetical protein [Hymenobacter chitinivorans]|uniref:Phospholipase D-like protein n=1 Tax=Hymenobacter chitinivorans DSM 11115 TaxID=1121954 RepID=A0A2M9B593_9BACT|nr:hypothetical protein [Hymenobacter chitinivorans]PJJ53094.1 hypothetical protein CLV45_3752 [Hymenobacter chitinivorans DSM 11115]
MNLFQLLGLWLLIVLPLPWIYTLIYIQRGEFPGRWEKRRWFHTVLTQPLIGLVLYWTRGYRRRRSKRKKAA